MDTYDLIAESALRLFYRQGYHATGVEQLSQEAGVTKKTLYRHFKSKELLVAAALTRRDDQFLRQMHAFMAPVAEADRPAMYMDFIAEWVSREGFYGCAFINAAAEYGEAGATPHLLAKQHKERVLTYLQEACRQAGLAAPERMAQQLFLVGEGVIVASQVAGPLPEIIGSAKQLAVWLTSPGG